MKIVVTGSIGHIGSYIIRDLGIQFPEADPFNENQDKILKDTEIDKDVGDPFAQVMPQPPVNIP